MSELLGADTGVLDRNAQWLSTDARTVQDILLLVQRVVVELQASWNGADLTHLTQQWEQQVSPLLARAYASLDTCAAQLRAQSAAQQATSSDRSLTALNSVTAMPMSQLPSPPTIGSPAGNAIWWRSLSPLEQQRMTREHPEWIGNRDGVSPAARDQANRALLTVDRGLLVTQADHLEGAIAEKLSRRMTPTDEPAALAQVRHKLASIDAVEATLARPGERQLLLLDLAPERAQAAIANGDVETADNVAVFVPGMSTTVNGSLKGIDRDMSHLQRLAQLESKAVNPALAATTATVTWIGYQAPGWGDLFNPDRSSTSMTMANRGAARLAPFLQGIGASRSSEAHLTLLGHSYGSTTAGLALKQDTGVNDAVFFGSPGLGTDHIEDLKLAPSSVATGGLDAGHASPGHVYYVEAPDDPVGDLGQFGMDPSHLDGVRHLSARESTVLDPSTGQTRHLDEVTGHSWYLLDNSTSQYNISTIVGGVPQRRVYDSGEGIGDLLSLLRP